MAYESADVTSDDVTNASTSYQVVIGFQTDTESGTIFARTPDTVSMIFGSQWAPVLSDKMGSTLWSVGMGSFGSSPNNIYSMAQYWVGNKPLEFVLDLEFVMRTSAYADVVVPIKTLAKLVLPSIGSFGLLSPPGPRLTAQSAANIAGGGNGIGGTNIAIKIGNFFMMPNAIVSYVAPNVKLQMDQSGKPVRATIRAGFSSFYVATVDAIDNWFLA